VVSAPGIALIKQLKVIGRNLTRSIQSCVPGAGLV